MTKTTIGRINTLVDARREIERLARQVDSMSVSTATLGTSDLAASDFGKQLVQSADAAAVRLLLQLGGLSKLDIVGETNLQLSDILTDDASTLLHGFEPKSPNDTTLFRRGDSTWAKVLAAHLGDLSGSATDVLLGTGVFGPPPGGTIAPVFPTPAVGVLGRWSPKFSTVTLSADGSYCAKITDLSGNGHDSDTMTSTARPRWLGTGYNRGYPGLRFNGTTQRMTFSSMPGLASPLTCTIIAVVQNYTTGTVNKHLVNWAGNPIVFLGGSGYTLYNGTLEASAASFTQVTSDLPPDVLSHPALMICEFNGAASSSKLTIGDVDYGFGSAGTAATGGTNFFTIGSDSGSSPSNFAGMILAELCVCPGILTSTERTALKAYYADALTYGVVSV